jgi:signal transduction histidine kinase/ligand-binding sensor domain-containing protein
MAQTRDLARSILQRGLCQVRMLRMQNRSALSIPLVVLLAVLFSAVAQAQANSTSKSPSADAPVSIKHRTIRMPLMDGTDIRFTRLSSSEGLSQIRVADIVDDDQGFLWFGTQYGVNRYDGHKFRVFTPNPASVNSLSGGYIYSLFKDRSGMLWIGCDLFLDRFDPTTETFSHYSLDSEGVNRSPGVVFRVSQDSTGLLWLATGSGLYEFDPHTGHITRHYRHDPLNPSSLSSNDVKATTEDRSGRFWVADGNNLEQFDRKTGNVILRIPLAESVRDFFFYEDRFGVIWIGYTASGGDGGFAYVDRKTNVITHYSFYNKESGETVPIAIHAMLGDENGTLWLGTMGVGLLRFDPAQQRVIRYRNQPGTLESLPDDRVIALAQDHEGNIWAGLQTTEPTSFNTRKGSFRPLLPQGPNAKTLGEKMVNAIYEDRERFLWIGTVAFLTRIDRTSGKTISYRPPESGLNNDLVSIAEDRSGFFWVGSNGQGLYRFDPRTGRFKTFRHNPADPSSLSDNTIIRLFTDHTGTMWLATWNGLDRFDAATQRFVVYKRDAQSRMEQYYDIAEDKDGTLWLGGNAGLQHFDPVTGTFTGYEHRIADPSSLSDNRVTSVQIDHAGTIWAATHSGLDKLNRESGTFTTYYTKDGLPSNRVHCILEDQQGDLWMSTSRGISRFDPVAKTFRNYSVADGLPGMDLTGWRTCFKSPSGEMFFGGFSGATSFYPDRVVDSAYVPPIVFTDFRLFGQPVEVGSGSPLKKSISYADSITLSHQQSTFSLEFAALSSSDGSISRYRYKLDGVDQQWNETGSDQRMVSYAALPDGDYTFHVQTATGQSGWGLPGATLHIQVLPPLWRTWWFRTIVAAVLLFIVWGVYHIRVRSIKEHYRERRQAEEALRQAHSDLIHANRVSSMGELTASLAHEVNQPIAAAITDASTCLRWLARDQPDLDEARAAASRSVKDATRAAEIIKRVRLLFKKGTLQRELVDLNEVIREMMLLLHSEATQFAVLVRTELAADLPRVMGDRVQLQQVLMNLMMNSIDAMKDLDGTRELTIQSQWGENGQVLISVSDTGVGLPPQQADKIFNAFFTTKTHGTGMGLRISHSIIESHGGRLWAADNSPRGARFCFTLPTSDKPRDLVMSGDRTGPADGLHDNNPSFESMNAERPTQRE